VDPAASKAMRDLMDKHAYPGNATRSPVADALPGTVVAVSKLGLLPGRESDCAFVERTHGTTRLRYVAVFLNAPTTAAGAQLSRALDRCVMENNGLA
ncbi:MAG: hypothetical protein M3135_00730, partial [Actinomycetota bacterium]|nr:hypothetical protein [Actinomycetota bacterium]